MIYLMIIVLVGGLLIFAVITAKGSNKAKSPSYGRRSTVDKTQIQAKWQSIQAVSKSGASGLRNSVLEADKLLDYVMKQQGYPGETMADRLRVAQKEFSNRDAVWRAHKLRNSMAHDIDFDLVKSQAMGALNDFERALKELKAL